ncbi:MAG TPA: glycerophosphodiester phosphodiesterase [Terriglobales bacterium]|jgi:glycerophosphoryl diester phosphodiesterase
MATPLLLGHRGLREPKLAPENSFAAFDLALEHGCDGFEFDVRLSGSGRAVITHDTRVGKVSVANATRDQLRELPDLAAVLLRYGQRVFLDIELKVTGLEQKLLRALREYPPGRDYVVSSFLPDVIMEIAARRTTIPLGIICDKKSQLAKWRSLPVDYVIVEQSLVNLKLIEEIRNAGRKAIVWTVNDARSIRRVSDIGVDAIISDHPKLLVSTLRPGAGKARTRSSPKTTVRSISGMT